MERLQNKTTHWLVVFLTTATKALTTPIVKATGLYSCGTERPKLQNAETSTSAQNRTPVPSYIYFPFFPESGVMSQQSTIILMPLHPLLTPFPLGHAPNSSSTLELWNTFLEMPPLPSCLLRHVSLILPSFTWSLFLCLAPIFVSVRPLHTSFNKTEVVSCHLGSFLLWSY